MKLILISLLFTSHTLVCASSLDTIDKQIKSADREVKELEKALQERVDEYNRLIQLKSAGRKEPDHSYHPKGFVCSDEDESSDQKKLSNLEKRVAELELKTDPKKKLESERSHLEKKASLTAPSLQAESEARAQYEQALSLLKNNELQKALGSFEVIVTDYPNDIYASRAQVQKAVIELKLHNYGNSIKSCEKALKMDLDDIHTNTIRITLASSYAATDQKHNACPVFKKIDKKHLDSDQKSEYTKLGTQLKCD